MKKYYSVLNWIIKQENNIYTAVYDGIYEQSIARHNEAWFNVVIEQTSKNGYNLTEITEEEFNKAYDKVLNVLR